MIVQSNVNRNTVWKSIIFQLPTGGAPLLDVIVFFHGGAFMFGSAHKYGPKYLLDRDVILVTVNYRLGPLGKLFQIPITSCCIAILQCV